MLVQTHGSPRMEYWRAKREWLSTIMSPFAWVVSEQRIERTENIKSVNYDERQILIIDTAKKLEINLEKSTINCQILHQKVSASLVRENMENEARV